MGTKQAESCKIKEEWMENDEGWLKNDEGRKMNDEWWRMKDDDFKLLKGFALGQTNKQMDKHLQL